MPVRFGALAILCFAATHAAGSPESERLVRRGLIEFEAQRYRDAIYFFGEAVKADPKDLHAVFLQGAALNRLGNYREAYLLMRGVENQSARHPEMDFEAGWALMGMGRARACVERLERFEKATPGRGQTSEFLGRCHLQLGNFDEAEKHLRQAIEREPRLKPSVDLSLARLEQARNRPDAARERLQAAAAANSPTGRALREILGMPEPVFQPERPLRFGASLAFGHNDNVIGLGNTVPLPGDITRKDANFLRAGANAAYTRALTAAASASVGYAGLFDRYDDLAAANLNDHFFYADLLHVLPRRIGVSLRLSHQYTEVSGDEFRDQSTVRPALSYRFTENSVTELAYAYAVADYHFPVAFDQFDRDGHVKGFSLVHQFRVPRSPWSGAFGVTHTRNRTRGSDFSFDANGASASASYAFTREVSAGVGIGYTRSDYLYPNSLSVSAPFDSPFAREDEQVGVSVQLVGPLAFGLRWFLQAQHLTNDSNIPFFHFTQNVVSAGIGANF